MRTVSLISLLLAFTMALLAAVGDGEWLARVPAKDAARQNPLAADPSVTRVGAKLFAQHCAECHGENGDGKNGKPSLHAGHVIQATPGQLFWLLTNGSLKNGMPSWSRLPEQQRWQLVAHVKAIVSR